MKKAWFIIIALQAKRRGSKLILHVTVSVCKSRAPQFRGILRLEYFSSLLEAATTKRGKGFYNVFLKK